MSFPFGGFESPEKSRKGRYSGADRDFIAEMHHDEGDPDPKERNLTMLEDDSQREKFEKEWREEHNINADLYQNENLSIWALGQSHMDIAWLWRLFQIVNKAKITCGKAAWHVHNLPDFKFTFSQPVMLEFLEKLEPDTFTAVKSAIETGRFELQGGCYVECDGKVPSGEAWCRQRLYGQRYYLEKFGKLATVEWLPDSFGYNNNIPQFAIKSGCQYFHTGKISGNWPPEEFPFANFKWRAPCGDEVIVYSANAQYRPLERWKLFGHTRKICKPGESLICDYSHPDPASDPALGEVYPHVLLIYGVGDGGHGPQSEEIHRLRYYIKQGYIKGFLTAAEFFAKYGEVADRLPVWNGAELFYNLHRGTLTTQALMKRMNRWFEWRLNSFQSMAALLGFSADISMPGCHESLTRLWKKTLLLQFHDILPGSSVPEVYDDAYDIWIENQHELMGWVHELWIKLGLTKPINGLIPPEKVPTTNWSELAVGYLNGNAYTGNGIIEIPLTPDWAERIAKEHPQLGLKISAQGEERITPLQFIPGEDLGEPLINRPPRLIAVCPIGAWEINSYPICEIGENIASLKKISLVDTNDEICVQSEYSEIVFDTKTGLINSFFDVASSKEIFKSPSHHLQLYRDWSPNEPAWNIGTGYRECPFDEEEQVFKGIRVIEEGPVRVVLEAEYKIPESDSIIRFRTIIYTQLPGLYFETLIDWHQTEAIVKDYFDFDGKHDKVVAEGPYSTEIYTADPQKRSHLDQQRWESCGHTWVAIPSGGTGDSSDGGVFYINDSKYGFDIVRDTFGITLLRGPQCPPPASNSYVAKERSQRPADSYITHADQMQHYIRYALIPFSGTWSNSHLKQYAHYFNAPPLIVMNSYAQLHNIPPRNLLPVHIHSDSLELVTVKSAEDHPNDNSTVIVRIVETGRQTVTEKIVVPKENHIKHVELVDLLERPLGQDCIKIEKEGDIVINMTATWRPHEIHTFRLSR